jgi:hypothetical protein
VEKKAGRNVLVTAEDDDDDDDERRWSGRSLREAMRRSADVMVMPEYLCNNFEYIYIYIAVLF